MESIDKNEMVASPGRSTESLYAWGHIRTNGGIRVWPHGSQARELSRLLPYNVTSNDSRLTSKDLELR
jgi:hypothetical protein